MSEMDDLKKIKVLKKTKYQMLNIKSWFLRINTISPKSTYVILGVSTPLFSNCSGLLPPLLSFKSIPFTCPSAFSYYFQVGHTIKVKHPAHDQPQVNNLHLVILPEVKTPKYICKLYLRRWYLCKQDMRLTLIKHFTITYLHSSEIEAEGSIQQSIKVNSSWL